ncbi:MAG: GntR family transcriptional regulator [Rhodospirillales bacterium]|nr:GntR family transcriptional regulator [Rhodospirillales bacterium]
MQDSPDFKPLYVQVKDLLVRRLVTGAWRPGEGLPSETSLAGEFGVSQGTVRKALDELAQQNLVVRQQGKGTFVATHTPQRALFHFFHLVGDDGARALPGSRLLAVRAAKATKAEAARLDLKADAGVVRLKRMRLLGGREAIVERIALPAARFPGLEKDSDLPNELYRHYELVYGVTVARAVEALKAIAANAEEAKLLRLAAGAPLLEIDRLAYALDGHAVEWRVSHCDTADHHYVSEIE